MYTPIQIGLPRTHEQSVIYKEYPPAEILNEVVYCFWTLRVAASLGDDFNYLVLPAECIDLIFDVTSTPESHGALIMTPSTTAELVRIRRDCSYTGVRLQPGAWRATPVKFVGQASFYKTLAGFDFAGVQAQLRAINSKDKRLKALEESVEQLSGSGIASHSFLLRILLARSFDSVEDFVVASGYSRRQFQRILQDSIGYSPYDFLKAIRFQRAIKSGKAAAEQYADKSHFIRECKRITGLTPVMLRKTYQLMAD